MIIDYEEIFKTTGGSEDLATSATTAVTSDYIDFATDKWRGAGRPLSVHVNIKSSTAAAGTVFTFDILECATSGGSYSSINSVVMPIADAVAGKSFDMIIPFNTKQFLKFKVTPAASMTGALTVNAAIVNL